MATNYYTNTSEDSIDGDEQTLYNLIMDYRASVGLASIALSKGLTAVAGRHVLDTVYNTGAYEGHAWSDAPYDSSDSSTYPNMWTAPTRIGTTYSDNGYEISTGYVGSSVTTTPMTPQTALDGWKSSPGHNAVIINESPWLQDWLAIGVAIHKGVSHVWFGNSVDPGGAPVINTAVADSGSETFVTLPVDTPDPDGSPFQIYRFYNTLTGAHFFTTSIDERNSVITNTPTMTYEGNAFDSNATDAGGGAAVFRFFNSSSGVHFYTASADEASNIRANLPQFIDEGVVYYASLTAGSGGTPLYRFYNTQNGTHFYTTSESERDNTINTLGQYNYEGIAYYVDIA
ncbi:MAG: CAP domain-containing protein [Hyphomicrobiales bacterium]